MTENPNRPAPVILWFRFDLRLDDHEGVTAALESGHPVFPVYVWDETFATRPLGAASKWWLAKSLKSLDEDLRKHGSRLIVIRGNTQVLLAHIAQQFDVKTIFCSKTFDPYTEESDRALTDALSDLGVTLKRFNTSLLSEPGTLRTKENKPFRVFTPFYKALQASGACYVDALPRRSTHVWPAPEKWPESLTIDELSLDTTATASGKDWSGGFDRFTPGAAGAHLALRRFLEHRLDAYENGRDRPDMEVTSYLSPHLRFAEISPRRLLHEIARAADKGASRAAGAAKFRSELAWREFSYGLLAQQPRLHEVNFRRDFDGFAWRRDEGGFQAWRRGETGYPLVDAGMRQLWRTGYMHNRVRMVAASFLVKHLLIDWRRGEQWFWDCLLDADPANNPANWQWVAGCGADAAPYFRIFNPLTQAEKFDPDAAYRTRFIPGYTPASARPVHSSNAPDLFDRAMDSPGYPQPVIDHAYARDRVLEAYKNRDQDHDRYGDTD